MASSGLPEGAMNAVEQLRAVAPAGMSRDALLKTLISCDYDLQRAADALLANPAGAAGDWADVGKHGKTVQSAPAVKTAHGKGKKGKGAAQQAEKKKVRARRAPASPHLHPHPHHAHDLRGAQAASNARERQRSRADRHAHLRTAAGSARRRHAPQGRAGGSRRLQGCSGVHAQAGRWNQEGAQRRWQPERQREQGCWGQQEHTVIDRRVRVEGGDGACHSWKESARAAGRTERRRRASEVLLTVRRGGGVCRCGDGRGSSARARRGRISACIHTGAVRSAAHGDRGA